MGIGRGRSLLWYLTRADFEGGFVVVLWLILVFLWRLSDSIAFVGRLLGIGRGRKSQDSV